MIKLFPARAFISQKQFFEKDIFACRKDRITVQIIPYRFFITILIEQKLLVYQYMTIGIDLIPLIFILFFSFRIRPDHLS